MNKLTKTRRKYRQSPKGLLGRIYCDQRARCKRSGMLMPAYSLHMFRDKHQESIKFRRLYKAWAASGFKINLRPSIDRIDCFKGYTLDNIALLTWAENRFKSKIEKKRHRKRKTTGGIR